MGVLSLKLSNGRTFIETNALLDWGSDTTLLRKDIAQRLNLKGKQEKLSVTSALSRSHDIDSATVSFDISSTSVSGSTQGNMKTPTRKIATWMISTEQFPPGKLSPKKIPTQDKSHLDNSHPGKLPPRKFSPGQLPTRKTSTQKIPTRISPTQESSQPENSYLDNSHPGKLPPGKFPPGQLLPRKTPTQKIATRIIPT